MDRVESFLRAIKEIINSLFRHSFGQDGGDCITGAATSETGSKYKVIYPTEDGVFGTVVGSVSALSTKNFYAGIPIYGVFDSVEITSGTIILYK